jgi:competence protein ComEC
MFMKELKMKLPFIKIPPFLLIAVLFIPLYLLRLSQVSEYKIPEGEKVKIVGRISQQPYHKDSYQIISLGPILITTSRFPGYFYGEKIQVIGKFQKKVINPFQTQYFTYFPAIQRTEGQGFPSSKFNLKQFLLKTRGRIEESLSGFLPEPEGSLLLGVLFGIKKQMPENFWQNLRKTGTLHLVVASGQNVTLVAGFLIEALVVFISRRKAVVLALIGIFLYVLLVGAEAPAVRAGIMIGFAYLAQIFGREQEAIFGLVFAAVAMLLFDPLILFDIGFQLSFAAMAGIITIYPKLKGQALRSPRTIWCGAHRVFSMPILGDGLAVTLSAQLATLPILLANFGQFSFLAPLINALVLPTIPFIMSLGGILAFLGLIIRPLAQVLAWFIWLFLAYFVKIVDWFSGWSWTSLEIGKLSFWWALGYYLVLGVIILKFNERN